MTLPTVRGARSHAGDATCTLRLGILQTTVDTTAHARDLPTASALDARAGIGTQREMT
jgi:hypothetical protein